MSLPFFFCGVATSAGHHAERILQPGTFSPEACSIQPWIQRSYVKPTASSVQSQTWILLSVLQMDYLKIIKNKRHWFYYGYFSALFIVKCFIWKTYSSIFTASHSSSNYKGIYRCILPCNRISRNIQTFVIIFSLLDCMHPPSSPGRYSWKIRVVVWCDYVVSLTT